MSILSNYLNLLNEGKSTSRNLVRQTREQKIAKAEHQLAILFAKKIGDPKYVQMMKFKKKYKELQSALHKRFKSKVRAQARL